MTTETNYLGNHFPPEIIRQAIWRETHDFRLFHAGPLGAPQTSAFQRATLDRPCHRDIGCVVICGAYLSVADLADQTGQIVSPNWYFFCVRPKSRRSASTT